MCIYIYIYIYIIYIYIYIYICIYIYIYTYTYQRYHMYNSLEPQGFGYQLIDFESKLHGSSTVSWDHCNGLQFHWPPCVWTLQAHNLACWDAFSVWIPTLWVSGLQGTTAKASSSIDLCDPRPARPGMTLEPLIGFTALSGRDRPGLVGLGPHMDPLWVSGLQGYEASKVQGYLAYKKPHHPRTLQ